jgi:hypothetical protein
MHKRIIGWLVGSLVMAAILTGAYYVVRANQAAMAGSTNGQPAAFFGH